MTYREIAPMTHAAFRRVRALDRIREEPPTIDADMRPSDIANTLKNLRFNDNGGMLIIRIDREARDFLVAAVERTH
jgi:hypothetical protein